jgi:hypothetical protein
MQLNDIICKIIETVKVQTNYTHSMFAQNFVFGQACFVNQYHYEYVMQVIHGTGETNTQCM